MVDKCFWFLQTLQRKKFPFKTSILISTIGRMGPTDQRNLPLPIYVIVKDPKIANITWIFFKRYSFLSPFIIIWFNTKTTETIIMPLHLYHHWTYIYGFRRLGVSNFNLFFVIIAVLPFLKGWFLIQLH